MLVNQQPRDPTAEIVELGIGPAAMIVDHRKGIWRTAPQQLRGRVQPVGIVQFRKVETEFRQQLRRRQPVADERVVVHVSYSSSTTAVVSISTLAAASTRPLTSTKAIAG